MSVGAVCAAYKTMVIAACSHSRLSKQSYAAAKFNSPSASGVEVRRTV